ncbi:MAG: hypothetical protein LH615_14590 [Ferruginibacter sp.]|nr:hypothetical protein [Ferruginibacter sp.]
MVLLITAAQFLLSAKCNKDGTGCLSTTASYNFNINAQWSPQAEVYNIGDTIFLNSIIPKTLNDNITNTSVDYSNSVGIYSDLGVGYLDTITRQAVPAKDSFKFVSVIGSFVERRINTNQGINFLYAEASTNYQFKGALICLKKGIYGFSVDNCGSDGLRGKNCTRASFSMTISNTDKHLYLHQYALGVDPNDGLLQKHGYDFRVQ